MIDESQIMANLGVAKIMPITNRTVCDVSKQATELSFGWESLNPDAVLDPQLNIGRLCVCKHRLQPFYDSVVYRNGLPFTDCIELNGDKSTVKVSAGNDAP